MSEEVGGYAVLKRPLFSLLNQISITAHDGGGFDDVDAGLPLETERLEALHDEPRRFEFAPTFFRVGVKMATVSNELFLKSQFCHDDSLKYQRSKMKPRRMTLMIIGMAMRFETSSGEALIMPAMTSVAPAIGEHMRPKAPDKAATMPRLGICMPNSAA